MTLDAPSNTKRSSERISHTRRILMRRQQVPILRRGHSHCLKYRTPQGRQKWESYRSEEEAQERRQQILEQFKNESYSEPKTFTFADFATEWLEQRLSIPGSTASAHASIIRRHLIPYFRKMKLSEIRPNVVQRFVINLSRQKVSSKTVRNATILLGGMLASPKGLSAVRQGLLR